MQSGYLRPTVKVDCSMPSINLSYEEVETNHSRHTAQDEVLSFILTPKCYDLPFH